MRNDEDFSNQVAVNNAMRAKIAKRNDAIDDLENNLGYDSQVASEGYDATERLKEEYPDLWGDQNIRQFFVNEDYRLVQAGDTRAPWDRYEAIAAEVKRQLAGNDAKEITVKKRYVSPEQRAIQEMAVARRENMEGEEE